MWPQRWKATAVCVKMDGVAGGLPRSLNLRWNAASLALRTQTSILDMVAVLAAPGRGALIMLQTATLSPCDFLDGRDAPRCADAAQLQS